MSDELPDELPDELRALLDQERARPEPSPEELARLRHAVDQRLTAVETVARQRWKISPKSLLLGAILGASAAHLADRNFLPPRVQVVERWHRAPSVTRTLSPDSGIVRSADAGANLRDAVADIESDVPTRPHATVTAAPNFTAERLLIERCSSALAHGNPTGALVAARAHARRFPRGLLVEEREALTIQALRALGRDAEASARTERFLRRWPTSLHAPSLRGARP